jgi:hypothetical protein
MEAQFADVINDHIGVRVATHCWAVADPYLKVRHVMPRNPPNNNLTASLGEACLCTAIICYMPVRFSPCIIFYVWARTVTPPAFAGGVVLSAYNPIINIG